MTEATINIPKEVERIPVEKLKDYDNRLSSYGDLYLIKETGSCFDKVYVNEATYIAVRRRINEKKRKIDNIYNALCALVGVTRATWNNIGSQAPAEIQKERGRAAAYQRAFSWLKERNERIEYYVEELRKTIDEAVALDGFISKFLEDQNWSGPHIVNHIIESAFEYKGPTGFQDVSCLLDGCASLGATWLYHIRSESQEDCHTLEIKLDDGLLHIYIENPLYPVSASDAVRDKSVPDFPAPSFQA